MSHAVEQMAYAYIENSNKEEYQHTWHNALGLTSDISHPILPDAPLADWAKKAGFTGYNFVNDPTITVNEKEEKLLKAIENNDLGTVMQFMRENLGHKFKKTGTKHIYRDSDGKMLTRCETDRWFASLPTPQEFCDFVSEYVAEGSMEMNTLGTLEGGTRMFALAKIKGRELSLFRGRDVTLPYFLFDVPIYYGKAMSARATNIRVVCTNTIELAHQTTDGGFGLRIPHIQKYDADRIKRELQIAESSMETYAEQAAYLAGKRWDIEDLKEYYADVYDAKRDEKTGEFNYSRTAKQTIDALQTQPGAELGEGTWWSAFNSVTHVVDHVRGRRDDSRLNYAWFGGGVALKQKALKKALEYAKKSKTDDLVLTD